MKDIDSILHSEYIIDGIRMEVTPAQMLGECMPYGTAAAPSREIYPPIVDEPADPAPGTVKYSPGLIPAYLEALKASGGDSGFPAEFSGAATRAAIARALIGTLWKKGHFSLEDIGMRISWEWDCAPVGSMAAFYFSAEAVSALMEPFISVMATVCTAAWFLISSPDICKAVKRPLSSSALSCDMVWKPPDEACCC